LLAPVAVNLNIDLIWFGILIALNLQTSFLTPPFGFALFYLRSVSPVSAFVDRVTKKRIEGVRTTDIYRGSIPFVLIQIVVLALLIAFPDLVTGSLDPGIEVDLDTIEIPRATDDAEWGAGGGAWD
jgi:TRAP-type mannitol/chloroaromatic compound transport system permease large subunit